MGVFLRSRTGLALLVFLGIAAFYLITEHTAHTLGALPFAILLLCPLMHLFMHGAHGADHGDHGPNGPGGHAGHGGPPQRPEGGAS